MHIDSRHFLTIQQCRYKNQLKLRHPSLRNVKKAVLAEWYSFVQFFCVLFFGVMKIWWKLNSEKSSFIGELISLKFVRIIEKWVKKHAGVLIRKILRWRLLRSEKRFWENKQVEEQLVIVTIKRCRIKMVRSCFSWRKRLPRSVYHPGRRIPKMVGPIVSDLFSTSSSTYRSIAYLSVRLVIEI